MRGLERGVVPKIDSWMGTSYTILSIKYTEIYKCVKLLHLFYII